jgi:hypothetical protein
MSKEFWKKTALSLGTILVIYLSLIGVSIGANLTPSTERFNNDHQVPDNYLAQVTSVKEFRDISPTDWSYEAIRSLVEDYGCMVGYGDRTFRGNRSIVRAEITNITNACLNVIERLETENVSPIKEDLETLKNLLIETIEQSSLQKR